MNGNEGVKKEDYHKVERAQIRDVGGIKLDIFSTTKDQTGEEGKISLNSFKSC